MTEGNVVSIREAEARRFEGLAAQCRQQLPALRDMVTRLGSTDAHSLLEGTETMIRECEEHAAELRSYVEDGL